MSQCPCINCITLPICKAQTIEHIKQYKLYVYASIPTYGFNLYTDILEPKCSLIRHWINEGNGYKRYIDIYHIFKSKDYNI